MRLYGRSATVQFGVRTPIGERRPVSRPDRPAVAAAAPPCEPDPVQHHAPQLSVRLLDLYGADTDSVQGHAA